MCISIVEIQQQQRALGAQRALPLPQPWRRRRRRPQLGGIYAHIVYTSGLRKSKAFRKKPIKITERSENNNSPRAARNGRWSLPHVAIA